MFVGVCGVLLLFVVCGLWVVSCRCCSWMVDVCFLYVFVVVVCVVWCCVLFVFVFCLALSLSCRLLCIDCVLLVVVMLSRCALFLLFGVVGCRLPFVVGCLLTVRCVFCLRVLVVTCCLSLCGVWCLLLLLHVVGVMRYSCLSCVVVSCVLFVVV